MTRRNIAGKFVRSSANGIESISVVSPLLTESEPDLLPRVSDSQTQRVMNELKSWHPKTAEIVTKESIRQQHENKTIYLTATFCLNYHSSLPGSLSETIEKLMASIAAGHHQDLVDAAAAAVSGGLQVRVDDQG